MSDSHIYELEDIVWDDFSNSDDHLVPYPQIQHDEGSAIQTKCHKKLKHETRMKNSTCSHGAELVGLATERTLYLTPKITSDKVLTDGSRSQKPDNGHTYNDQVASLSSEGQTVTRGDVISNNNFYTGASHSINNCSASDNNSFYSLSDTTRNLSFFCNGHENKDIDNSLFYEWPDIGNYDLTQMLRSYDSSCRLRHQMKEDGMCLFSSSTAVNGPDVASQSQAWSSYSDSNSLKIFSENFESPQPTYESPTVDALKKRSAGASQTSSTLPSNTTWLSYISKAPSINEFPAKVVKMDKNKAVKEISPISVISASQFNIHSRNMDSQTQSMETKVPLHHFDSSKLTSKTVAFSNKILSSGGSGLHKQKVVGVSSSDPLSAPKKFFNSENEENLKKSSQSAENLLKETSFLQLQEVMEQMDLKTKLCIRDSLYRLARCAEQRHGIANLNHACKADKNSNEASMAGIKQAGPLDIETDTNPVDRSIAHLLFHRPRDPSRILTSNMRPGHNVNDGAELFHIDDFKNAGFHAAKKEE